MQACLSLAAPAHAENEFNRSLPQSGELRDREILATALKSAAQGNVEAQLLAGEMLYYGPAQFSAEVQQDHKEARTWFERAAANGSRVAAYHLCWHYANHAACYRVNDANAMSSLQIREDR
jgi:TPR repeat protein